MSTDLRKIHYSEIVDTLTGKRELVYEAGEHLPSFTAIELADILKWDKTSTRPRITELRKAGLVEETGERRNGEHAFRCVSLAEAERRARVAEQIAADTGEMFTLSGE